MGDQLLNKNELIAIRTKSVTFHASAAVTADGDSKTTPVKSTQFTEGNFFLDVTVLPGTPSPTFDVSIVTKDPVSGKWHTLTSFTQATGVTSEMKKVTGNLGAFLAVVWTKGGDATGATFSVGAVLKA